jgi:alpha-tubulin suppressor-like RCC1 family protein
LTPIAVVGVSDAAALEVGDNHSCVLLSDDTARCWGINIEGTLGNTPLGTAISAPLQPDGLGPASELVGGGSHTCARLAAGSVFCWGTNQQGQLGDGTTTPHTVPAPLNGITSVVQLAAGGSHTCAVDGSGAVWCWGANEYGQLGVGNTLETHMPAAVTGIPSAAQVVATEAHTCALLQSGEVACWGFNFNGQIGQPASFNSITTPKVVPGLSGVASISAGMGFTCALMLDGTVRCWGLNADGQLGIGTMNAGAQSVPQTVTGLSNVTKIACGHDHTCALSSSGEVFCWGENAHGELGDGTMTSRSSPTPVVW